MTENSATLIIYIEVKAMPRRATDNIPFCLKNLTLSLTKFCEIVKTKSICVCIHKIQIRGQGKSHFIPHKEKNINKVFALLTDGL